MEVTSFNFLYMLEMLLPAIGLCIPLKKRKHGMGNAAGDFVGGIRHSYVCVVCFDMGDTDFFNLFLYGKQYL